MSTNNQIDFNNHKQVMNVVCDLIRLGLAYAEMDQYLNASEAIDYSGFLLYMLGRNQPITKDSTNKRSIQCENHLGKGFWIDDQKIMSWIDEIADHKHDGHLIEVDGSRSSLQISISQSHLSTLIANKFDINPIRAMWLAKDWQESRLSHLYDTIGDQIATLPLWVSLAVSGEIADNQKIVDQGWQFVLNKLNDLKYESANNDPYDENDHPYECICDQCRGYQCE